MLSIFKVSNLKFHKNNVNSQNVNKHYSFHGVTNIFRLKLLTNDVLYQIIAFLQNIVFKKSFLWKDDHKVFDF